VDIGTETTTFVAIDEIGSNGWLRGANEFTIDSDEERFKNLDPHY
jgi:hypothetical protein